MAVHYKRRGSSPPRTPPSRTKRPQWEKYNLPLEESCRVIFGTHTFGSQTHPPITCWAQHSWVLCNVIPVEFQILGARPENCPGILYPAIQQGPNNATVRGGNCELPSRFCHVSWLLIFTCQAAAPLLLARGEREGTRWWEEEGHSGGARLQAGHLVRVSAHQQFPGYGRERATKRAYHHRYWWHICCL